MKQKKLFVGLMLGVCMFMMTGCGKKTILLNDYITVNPGAGASGYGTVYIDDSAVVEQIVEAAEIKDMFEYSRIGVKIEGAYEFTITPNENLKNGDEVTITCKIDSTKTEGEKFKFAFKEFKYTVEGLKEVPTLTTQDLWKDFEIAFEGMSPDGYVTTFNTKNELLSGMYVCDKRDGLSNGDEVIVTCNANESQGYDYIVDESAELTKTFIVSGLTEIVDELEDISTDELKEMYTQMNDWMQLKNVVEANKTETKKFNNAKNKYDEVGLKYREDTVIASNIELEKIYFRNSDDNNHNAIIFLYSMNIDGTGNSKFGNGDKYYMSLIYDETIIINSDGKSDIDTGNVASVELPSYMKFSEYYANEEYWREQNLTDSSMFANFTYKEYGTEIVQ